MFACKFFAVERAFVNAFLDIPREIDVPYFAASNIASKNIDEHRKETLVASDTAVTILATFSESRVPSMAWFMSWILLVAAGDVNCPAIANQKCCGREGKGKQRKEKRGGRRINTICTGNYSHYMSMHISINTPNFIILVVFRITWLWSHMYCFISALSETNGFMSCVLCIVSILR